MLAILACRFGFPDALLRFDQARITPQFCGVAASPTGAGDMPPATFYAITRTAHYRITFATARLLVPLLVVILAATMRIILRSTTCFHCFAVHAAATITPLAKTFAVRGATPPLRLLLV